MSDQPGHAIPPTCPTHPDVLLSLVWEHAVHRDYAGVVGKDPESPHMPGRTL